MAKGFINPNGGLNIDQFNEKTVFVEPGQFPNPVERPCILLFQIQGKFLSLFVMKPPVNSILIKKIF